MGDRRTPADQDATDDLSPVPRPEQPLMDDAAGGPDADDQDD